MKGWIKFFPFILLLIYWVYLVAATRPLIIFDAIGYQDLGRLIKDHGLGVYFQGLYREPFFPLLISAAMHLEESTGIGYNYFLKIFLLLELAIAMAGVYRLARLLGAGRFWAGAASWYLGFSPAILNSTLWMWSEAAVYPFVIWGIVWLIDTWQELWSDRNIHDLVWYALLASGFFILATMVKASLAAVYVGFLLPFYICFALGVFQRRWRQAYRAALVSLIGILMMGAYVENYKFLNWKGNGNYEVTGRADLALLGNTVRRLHPDALNYIPQAFLSAPRLGICEKYYGRSCSFWSALTSDRINDEYGQQLKAQGFDDKRRREMFMTTSFRLMREHPFQEFFFSMVEGMKMFFWDNKIFFVTYPDFLARLHTNVWLVNTRCLVVALLSFAAFLTAVFRAWHFRRMPDFLAAFFVCLFIGSYMLFFVDIRYSFPLAPVFLAMMAAMVSWPRKDEPMKENQV